MIEVCEAAGTELAREIKLTDWSMARNLSNRSSGVQIPRDICTRLKRYLYSATCSWIRSSDISLDLNSLKVTIFLENCSLLETVNVRKQISAHIFAPNGSYCLYSVNANFEIVARENGSFTSIVFKLKGVTSSMCLTF